MLWALLVLPWVAGLALTRRHHLDAGGRAVVLTVSLGLPTLWVTWATFRDARRSGAAESGPGMPRMADELAAAVGTQWGKEAAVRRLNDPYPLPVSWPAGRCRYRARVVYQAKPANEASRARLVQGRNTVTEHPRSAEPEKWQMLTFTPPG